jgi:hypothetical protein
MQQFTDSGLRIAPIGKKREEKKGRKREEKGTQLESVDDEGHAP